MLRRLGGVVDVDFFSLGPARSNPKIDCAVPIAGANGPSVAAVSASHSFFPMGTAAARASGTPQRYWPTKTSCRAGFNRNSVVVGSKLEPVSALGTIGLGTLDLGLGGLSSQTSLSLWGLSFCHPLNIPNFGAFLYSPGHTLLDTPTL